jgi:hypothetical protein
VPLSVKLCVQYPWINEEVGVICSEEKEERRIAATTVGIKENK